MASFQELQDPAPGEEEGLMIVKVEDCSWEQEHAQPVNSRESEACRQRFRQFCYRDAGGPHEAFSQLWELCCRWLRPELNSKEQILELLVLEQFLAVLPGEIQARVRTQHLGSGEEAVALVEDIQNQSLKTWPQVREESFPCLKNRDHLHGDESPQGPGGRGKTPSPEKHKQKIANVVLSKYTLFFMTLLNLKWLWSRNVVFVVVGFCLFVLRQSFSV